MVSIPGALKVWTDDNILFVQLDHAKDTNPFSRVMTKNLITLCKEFEDSSDLKGMILTGGEGRSFSAGGDFNDVSKLRERAETDEYLREIIDLYQGILKVTKPVVALIDHFAIGQGLQVALMTDWRLGSDRSQVQMPELKNGVACPLGALILEFFFGRGAMLHEVIGCQSLSAKEAFESRILNQLAPPHELFSEGKKVMRKFLDYPEVPYRMTKSIHNRRFLKAFEDIRDDAAEAHIQSFLAKSGKAHFQKILAKK